MHADISTIQISLSQQVETLNKTLEQLKEQNPQIDFKNLIGLTQRMAAEAELVGEYKDENFMTTFDVSNQLIELSTQAGCHDTVEALVLSVISELAKGENIPTLIEKYIQLSGDFYRLKTGSGYTTVKISVRSIIEIFGDIGSEPIDSFKLGNAIECCKIGLLHYRNLNIPSDCVALAKTDITGRLCIDDYGVAYEMHDGTNKTEASRDVIIRLIDRLISNFVYNDDERSNFNFPEDGMSILIQENLMDYEYCENRKGIEPYALTFNDLWAYTFNEMKNIDNTFGSDKRLVYGYMFGLTFFGIQPCVAILGN